MKTELHKTETELTVFVEGRIDALTAPDLENELKEQLADATKVILDFAAVTFISSAGIRIILWTAAQMNNRQGTMVLRNVSDTVMEVFVLTGLDTALNFE